MRNRLLEYANGTNSSVRFSNRKITDTYYIQKSAGRISLVKAGAVAPGAFELLGVNGRVVGHSEVSENGNFISTGSLSACMFILRATENPGVTLPLIIGK